MLTLEDKDVPDLPTWSESIDREEFPRLSKLLSQTEKEEVLAVARAKPTLFCNSSGRTSMTEMSIDIGETTPIHTPPYRIPHARQKLVKEEWSSC